MTIWKKSADIEKCRLEILDQLHLLKELVDDEFDHEADWPEVEWINERIVGLEAISAVKMSAEESNKLLEEFGKVRGIHEALDRLCDKSARPLIWNLKAVASQALGDN